MNNGDEYKCIFCGDATHEVDYMVASPDTGAAVCDDCIGELVCALEELKESKPKGPLH